MGADFGVAKAEDDRFFWDVAIEQVLGNAGFGFVVLNPDEAVDDFDVDGGGVEVLIAVPAEVEEGVAIVGFVAENVRSIGAVGAVAVVGVFLQDLFNDCARA